MSKSLTPFIGVARKALQLYVVQQHNGQIYPSAGLTYINGLTHIYK